MQTKEEISERRRKYRESHKEEIKEYHKTYNKNYSQKNKEKIKEIKRKYRLEHMEEARERERKYRENHKEEIKERRRKHYQEHKEEIDKKRKKYCEEHKEQIKETKKIYRENNREQFRESGRRYYQEHKEEQKEGNKKYRLEHKEQIAKSKSAYYREHKKEINEYHKNYRIKNKGTPMFKAHSKSRNKKARDRGKKFLNELKQKSSCKSCGYKARPEILEFHHRVYRRDLETKEYGVSQMCNFPLWKLKKELSKCDVLCPNCHKEIHFKDNGLNYTKVKVETKNLSRKIILQEQRRLRGKNYLNEIKKKGCVSCSYKEIPEIIEFHHIIHRHESETKDYPVSCLISHPLERIKKELAKCEVLCPNCHTFKHFKDNGFNFSKQSASKEVGSCEVRSHGHNFPNTNNRSLVV